jgi:DNA-binding response OmpR family regulator
MRILIVDDHEISRAALSALMRTEGIDVTDVRTGDAAITAAIAFHPDVVIVDVAPADPAGFLIARRLQALPDAPRVYAP